MKLTQEQTNRIFNTITSNGCREMEEDRFNQAVNEAIEQLVMPKIADIEEILKFIQQFQDEQSSGLRRTYDGFINITKNNIELLQKLKRKIKSNFTA